MFSFLWQPAALPAGLACADRKTGRGHTGKAHWQSMGHGPHLLASTLWRLSGEKWRLCSHTDTSCGRLVRCGFGRRWEETAQRGHNYSAAASTATTSSFSKEESLTKQLAQAITNNFSPTCTLDADTLHQLSEFE